MVSDCLCFSPCLSSVLRCLHVPRVSISLYCHVITFKVKLQTTRNFQQTSTKARSTSTRLYQTACVCVRFQHNPLRCDKSYECLKHSPNMRDVLGSDGYFGNDPILWSYPRFIICFPGNTSSLIQIHWCIFSIMLLTVTLQTKEREK